MPPDAVGALKQDRVQPVEGVHVRADERPASRPDDDDVDRFIECFGFHVSPDRLEVGHTDRLRASGCMAPYGATPAVGTGRFQSSGLSVGQGAWAATRTSSTRRTLPSGVRGSSATMRISSGTL